MSACARRSRQRFFYIWFCLMGISFTLPSGSSTATSMEVTLAYYKSDEAPEKADFLAQADQIGSGDQALRHAADNQPALSL